MSSSHRAFVRRPVTLPVDYVTAEGLLLHGIVRNLSLQGMYIACPRPQDPDALGPGAVLTAAFVLPSGRPCKVLAAIVHRDRHGYGMQFRQMPPPSHANLYRYWTALD